MRHSRLLLLPWLVLSAPACGQGSRLDAGAGADKTTSVMEPAPTATVASASTPVATAAPTSASSAPLAAPVTPGTKASSPSAELTLSSPPWPADTSKVGLSWVLHPGRADADGVTRMHIDLVARAGAVTRVFPIEASYTVWFAIETQALCQGAGWTYNSPSTVAQLYLFGGGNTWYTVNRRGPESLEVVESSSSDGICTDSAEKEIECPVSRKVLGHIEVPAGATFTERFLYVEREETGVGPGKIHERLIECPPPSAGNPR